MRPDADVGEAAFIEARPEFAKNAQPGDIIVATENFGCGSSREYAVEALRRRKVGAIIALSFARIFFRNALNLGIPLFEAPRDRAARCRMEMRSPWTWPTASSSSRPDGDQIYALPQLPDFAREILAAGGIVNYVKQHGRFPGEEHKMHACRKLCVIEGDGIGREVIPAAVRVLRAAVPGLEIVHAEAGWECFLQRGVSVPEETLAAIRGCGAALFGAVSSPSRKVEGYRSAILTMRQELDLYANLRPVRSLPRVSPRPGIDLMVVRENTEGLYAGRERLEDGRRRRPSPSG